MAHHAGVNFAHGDNLAAAAAFHELWLREFRAEHLKQSVWGGDQDTCANSSPPSTSPAKTASTGAWAISPSAFCPARVTIFPLVQNRDERLLSDALVLHFKGSANRICFPMAPTYPPVMLGSVKTERPQDTL